MPVFSLSRLLFVFLAWAALGCARKGEDPAPATPPPASLTGTWEMTTQVITTYDASGAVLTRNTYDTYVANGELWRYVFDAAGRFDYTYQGQTQRRGTYVHTPTSLVQTNDPGFGSRPTFTFAIQRLSAAELVLVNGSQAPAGQESVTTWVRR